LLFVPFVPFVPLEPLLWSVPLFDSLIGREPERYTLGMQPFLRR
jgi:hypothetical protein